jgi:hypothetical protein
MKTRQQLKKISKTKKDNKKSLHERKSKVEFLEEELKILRASYDNSVLSLERNMIELNETKLRMSLKEQDLAKLQEQKDTIEKRLDDLVKMLYEKFITKNINTDNQEVKH